MVVLTVGMAVVQEMCSRMGAVTGKGLSDLIRENFPLRLTVFIMFVFLLANGGVIVSEFLGIAAALNLFGVPSWIGAPCGGLFIWWLVARGSYKRVENIFLLCLCVLRLPCQTRLGTGLDRDSCPDDTTQWQLYAHAYCCRWHHD
jgi:Mn2+/Fe2+ NRAMP family transporter